jgi:hypothetical protein
MSLRLHRKQVYIKLHSDTKKAASRPHRRITVDLGKTAHRGRIAERSVLERQQSAALLTIPDSRRIRSSDNKKPILFGLGTLLPQAIKPSA